MEKDIEGDNVKLPDPEEVKVCTLLDEKVRVGNTVGDKVGVKELDAHCENVPVPDGVWDKVVDTVGDKLLVTVMVMVGVWAAVAVPVKLEVAVGHVVGEVLPETLCVSEGV